MRIALIGDVHSNQYAFEAVLNDVQNKHIDLIIFLGDYIFGGSGSCEVVDMLMHYTQHPFVAISGNKEDYINQVETNPTGLHPVLYYIYKELGPERINYLKSLPTHLIVNVAPYVLKVCHNPSKQKVFKITDRLYRHNSVADLNVLAEEAISMEEDICIFGHYHLYMDEAINGKRFICASSVGLPLDGNSLSKYVILDINDLEISTSLQFVNYNHMQVVQDFENKRYFENFDAWSMNTVISMLTGNNYIGTQDLRNKQG